MSNETKTPTATTAANPAPVAPPKTPLNSPAQPGKMRILKCELVMNSFGSTTPKENVTPAEACLLVAQFHSFAGKMPLINVEITGEIDRTDTQELNRLKGLYPLQKVNALYSGAIPRLPSTFEEAFDAGTKVVLPDAKLVEHRLFS